MEELNQIEIKQYEEESKNEEKVSIPKDSSKQILIASFRAPPKKQFLKLKYLLFSIIIFLCLLILLLYFSINNYKKLKSLQIESNLIIQKFHNKSSEYQKLEKEYNDLLVNYSYALKNSVIQVIDILNAVDLSPILIHDKINYILIYFNVYPHINSNKIIYVKIFNPKGQLLQNEESPKGYTLSLTTDDKRIRWGNDIPGKAFSEGEYIIEFWIENNLVGGKKIIVQ